MDRNNSQDCLFLSVVSLVDHRTCKFLFIAMLNKRAVEECGFLTALVLIFIKYSNCHL